MHDDFIPAFGRHETFHPRYAWLKKAYDKISEDPLAFRREDATVRFGVGKNMVNAIKFWSLAFKITKETKKGIVVTGMGRRIFDDDNDDGIDPYLERPETLWLLHWMLLSKPCRVPVWWIILNEIRSVRIKADSMQAAVMHSVQAKAELGEPSPHSMKRDMTVFMHMYTSKQDRLTPEEYLDCPFRNMGTGQARGGIRQVHVWLQDRPFAAGGGVCVRRLCRKIRYYGARNNRIHACFCNGWRWQRIPPQRGRYCKKLGDCKWYH